MGDDGLPVSARTDVFIVRHAEVHNPADILYGRLPGFGLSERGQRQAAQTATFLSSRPITALYTSPLLRARQTARIVSSFLPSANVRTDSGLLEVRTGYQGEPNSILKPGFSFYEPRVDVSDETMEEVFARMFGFLRRAVRRHDGEAIVAVSHADPIAILRLGLERNDLTVSNLHRVVYPDRASVNHLVLEPHAPLKLSYFDAARSVAA